MRSVGNALNPHPVTADQLPRHVHLRQGERVRPPRPAPLGGGAGAEVGPMPGRHRHQDGRRDRAGYKLLFIVVGSIRGGDLMFSNFRRRALPGSVPSPPVARAVRRRRRLRHGLRQLPERDPRRIPGEELGVTPQRHSVNKPLLPP